jgi:osmoprotectant transport system substrate-binding protein
LGEIFAQLVEAKTKLRVERQFDLGGTLVCHGAITKNQIDMYPEYTGTGLSTVMHIEDVRSPEVALATVSREYKSRYNLVWLAPLGFNNTWALIVTQKMARANAWANISDLRSDAPNLHIGLTSEFAERADGYPGVKRVYNLNFGKVSDVDTNIAYKALAERGLDVAAGNSTDGRLEAYKLKLLIDDKHFFCPYQAAPVIRDDTLKAHPELAEIFDGLANKIDDEEIRHLNYLVDGEHQSPADVARRFLKDKHLI